MLNGTNLQASLSAILPFAVGNSSLSAVSAGGLGINTEDAVSLSGNVTDLEGVQNQQSATPFADVFTQDVAAYLLGTDTSKLTSEQSADLTSFLEDIYNENVSREASGEEPMSRDEINAEIQKQISAYDENVTAKGDAAATDKETAIGKTLKELGITELNEEQMAELDEAYNAYTDGDKDALDELTEKAEKFKSENADKAKEAEEAKEAEADKAAESKKKEASAAENQKAANNSSSPSGSSGGSGGSGGVGGSSGGGGVRSAGGVGASGSSNSTSSASETAAGDSGFDLAEDLEGLQQQKAQAEAKSGEISGEIDNKKSEMNRRKGQLVDEAAEAKDKDDAKTKGADEYKQAQTDFDKAKGLKDTAQTSLTQANHDLANNQSDLLKNTSDRQSNASDLSSARSELSSLSKPSAPSGDDKEAQAAYESQLSEYQSKKSEIESKISDLEGKKSELESQFEKLESKKDELQTSKSKAEKEVQTQTEAMNKAQETMDKQLEKMQKDDPELQKAIEEDSELKGLEEEVASLEEEMATQKNLVAACDEQIAALEKEDAAAQGLKLDESERKLDKAVEAAGANDKDIETQAQDEASQAQYGKPYAELSAAEKDSLEFAVDGEKAVGSMEWAENELLAHRGNQEARAIVEAGQEYLALSSETADSKATAAVSALPDNLKEGATGAMDEAIAKAEEAGEDVNMAARQALADYTKSQLESGDLSDEDRTALQAASGAAASSASAMQNCADGQRCQDNIAFVDSIAEMPNDVRSEAITLLNSVKALDDPSARDMVELTTDVASKYIEAHPDEDISMEQAREKWGDYGPIVLTGLQDPEGDVASRLFGDDQAPYNDGGIPADHSYNGDSGELFRSALVSHANLELGQATSDYSASASEGAVSAEDWIATGTDDKAKEARAWKAVGMDSEAAAETACSDSTTKLREAATVVAAQTVSNADEVVSKWLTGDTEGLNPELASRLAKIGETLGQPVNVTSGYRSYEEQAELYEMYCNGTGNLAAKPGTSRHESGNAADCSFNGQNLGAVPEARALAEEYGLCFPVSGEDWHIELS